MRKGSLISKTNEFHEVSFRYYATALQGLQE